MMLRTSITDLFAISHPILLAPMGMISGGALAAAVSRAGGLGMLGAGYGDADWLERELTACGDARIGVGFITWSLATRPHLLDQVLERDPVAVMLSFGDVRPFATRIRDTGAKLICQVQTVEGAREAVAAGADVIVAQGSEAGGHGAARATFTLVPAVVDAVAPVPVLAAGGVADGRGLAAALALGAEGVLVGTRFYASSESLGHERAKRRIVEAAGDDTVRTTVFDVVRGIDWPAPYTGRAVANRFTERWHGAEAKLAGAVADERERYLSAAAEGNVDIGVLFAGEDVDLIDDVPSAAEIVERMADEAKRCLHQAARRVE